MEHEILSLEKACMLPLNELVDMYNGAVWDIWELEESLRLSREECDLYAEAYEKLSNKLYG